jgi:endogenous inhibitor of DNA gyrase (YacG/DUF329 family)
MNCPICKKPVADEGADRPVSYPFCSERCKLIDLGRWLDGKYQIPVQDNDHQSSDSVPDDDHS